MATVTEDVLAVLRDARLSASDCEGGWLKRSTIVAKIYGEGTVVNAHHRGILKNLVHCGDIQERHRSKGHSGWFEYRDAR